MLTVAWRGVSDSTLPRNMAITLARVGAAFVAGLLVGSILGYATGRLRKTDALLDPWAVLALNLPVLVVVVLAYIWIGLTDIAAVMAVALAKRPPSSSRLGKERARWTRRLRRWPPSTGCRAGGAYGGSSCRS
ncbi:MAG: hypothetical protein ACJ8AW_34250 [Rhodopila sp.]